MQIHVATNKKEYEIIKALEINKSIRIDNYYVIRYEKRKNKDVLLVKRGVSTGWPTVTKWKLYIDDLNIIAEKQNTFDQYISLVFILLYTLIAGFIFIMLLLALIISVIRGSLYNLSAIGVVFVIVLEIISIICIIGYKHIYYDKPKEILKNYLRNI